MRSVLKQKKGVLGLDTAQAFIIAILTLAVVAFAVIIALDSLNNSTTNADAGAIFANVTAGTSTLFGSAGTWFALLAVVIIILIIAVVILAVRRFGGQNTGGL